MYTYTCKFNNTYEFCVHNIILLQFVFIHCIGNTLIIQL